MLLLVFQLGKDRYAVDAAQIVEVLPLVNTKHIPGAPVGVAGVFNYHGVPVPLIDLTELTLGEAGKRWMSTRIILVNYSDDSNQPQLLGLLAEHATELLRRGPADFMEAGITVQEAPYLGAVTTDGADIIQLLDVKHLLPQRLRVQLFCERADVV